MLATFSYGAISATPKIWRSESKYINSETHISKKLPVPIVDRYGVALFKICVAPVWWPFFLRRDLMQLELYCKGIDPRTYGIDPDEDMF
jgi:hypothetical protein